MASVSAPALPLFIALPKGMKKDDYAAMFDKLDEKATAYQVSGDVWKRVIGDGAADYARFVAYVVDKGADGRRRFRGVVVPEPEVAAGTFQLVQRALAAALPVLCWQRAESRFVAVTRVVRVPGATFQRAARLV